MYFNIHDLYLTILINALKFFIFLKINLRSYLKRYASMRKKLELFHISLISLANAFKIVG